MELRSPNIVYLIESSVVLTGTIQLTLEGQGDVSQACKCTQTFKSWEKVLSGKLTEKPVWVYCRGSKTENQVEITVF